jgi:hypothetical protein
MQLEGLFEKERRMGSSGLYSGSLSWLSVVAEIIFTPPGMHSVLTPRLIRTEVEKLFGLEPGTLDTKAYKLALKQAASDEALVCLPVVIIHCQVHLSTCQQKDDNEANEQSGSKNEKKRELGKRDDSEIESAKTTKKSKPKATANAKGLKQFKSSVCLL